MKNYFLKIFPVVFLATGLILLGANAQTEITEQPVASSSAEILLYQNQLDELSRLLPTMKPLEQMTSEELLLTAQAQEATLNTINKLVSKYAQRADRCY